LHGDAHARSQQDFDRALRRAPVEREHDGIESDRPLDVIPKTFLRDAAVGPHQPEPHAAQPEKAASPTRWSEMTSIR